MSNDAKTSAISGCVIWLILISVISSCMLPVFFAIGTISSFSDFAIQTTGGWLCPEGTTPQSHTYATTSRDENGFEHPATGYELQCLDSSGEIVKTDPILYSFIWIGIWAGIGLIVSVVLTFILAVPSGMFVTRILNNMRVRRSNTM
jgi:hypothetical protein